MEELLYSIPKDKWEDFNTGSHQKQKKWLKEHLLSKTTDFFHALVLSKVQSLPVTRKDVTAFMGNRLPEAFATILDRKEIPELIKKFNKLVIREVTNKIQSIDQDSMKKLDKRLHTVDQVELQENQTTVDGGNTALHTLRTPKSKAKGTLGIYNKYRGGGQWLKEGVPKLPTIPEATQMEEMLAEIHHFGYTIQNNDEVNVSDMETQQSGKACNTLKPDSPPLEVSESTMPNELLSKSLLDNNNEVSSLKESDNEKQPSREELKILKSIIVDSGYFTACGLSESPTAQVNSTENLSLENEQEKTYVAKIIEMLLVQALQISYLSCSREVFHDIHKYLFEKVWTDVREQIVRIRSKHLDRFVNKIFSKMCRCIFCPTERALSLFIMRVPELEEVYLGILKKFLLKKVGIPERFVNFMYDVYDKINCEEGPMPLSSCDKDSYSEKSAMMEPGDTHDNKVEFLQEGSEAAQITSTRGPEDEIKTALQTLLKNLTSKMTEQPDLSFKDKHGDALGDMLFQEIWNEIVNKDIKLSVEKVAKLHEAIFKDIWEKGSSTVLTQEYIEKLLNIFKVINIFKSSVIEDLMKLP